MNGYGANYGYQGNRYWNRGPWGPGYDRDFGRGRGGGYRGPGSDLGEDIRRGYVGRGFEHYGGGMEGSPAGHYGRGGPFRGRGRGAGYDTYFRRDFVTNQGEFGPESGGGGRYGYRGASRGRTSYGPHYGERWESTHPEDIARRNFERW